MTTLAAITLSAVLALTITGCGARQAETTGGKGGELALATPFTDALGLVEAAKAGTRKTKSSKSTIDTAIGGSRVKGTIVALYDGVDSKLTANMSSDGEQVEMRLVDRVLFIKMGPAEQADLKTDKPWAKIELESENPRAKAAGKALTKSFEMGDPAKQLELVEKTGRIISSEQTRLNGVPVNHYFVEFDARKQLNLFLGEMGELPADKRAEIERRFEGKDLRIPAELWLNAEQLPLKMTIDMTGFMKAMGAPADVDAKSTYDYSDWGTDVPVSVPPAGEVADYIALLEKAGR
ncbi:hypothetical protein [Amycolatopsis pittospori]|uniref:hypothetical protein n=1 Tax=Amycolatopsis pittospori TaxID=2749434 RepID=UPI0015EFE484|nr:hypothetical protein [Amycolatopsis pittospori]